jgi:hypothetical protein
MKAKRVVLTLLSGLEIRLFGAEVSREGRRCIAKNHRASLVAEWVSGKPFATLNVSEGEIPLGIVEPRGMKGMEYLANH